MHHIMPWLVIAQTILLGQDDGILGMIMVIHTFGDYVGFIRTFTPLPQTGPFERRAPSIVCPKACPEPVEGRTERARRDLPLQGPGHVEG
jgi:hypothetical protein